MKRLERLENEVKEIKEHLGIINTGYPSDTVDNNFWDMFENKKPQEGEYWWLSGLDTSGCWRLGRVKSLPASDKDVANVQYCVNNNWQSSAKSISKFFERKMTNYEIEDELSKVAWKLGFIEGNSIDMELRSIEIGGNINFRYLSEFDVLIMYHGNRNPQFRFEIYHTGQWAEIISKPEPKKEIPIHDSWKANIIGDRDDELPSEDEIFDKGYEEGAKEFVQRFYNRAMEYYKIRLSQFNIDGHTFANTDTLEVIWKDAKLVAAQEILEGKLKKQNNDKS